MIVGGYPLNRTTEVIKLTPNGIYHCESKDSTILPLYGNVGADIFGQSVTCGGYGDVKRGRGTNRCYIYDEISDTLEETPDWTLPFNNEFSASTVLKDGSWWITGG